MEDIFRFVLVLYMYIPHRENQYIWVRPLVFIAQNHMFVFQYHILEKSSCFLLVSVPTETKLHATLFHTTVDICGWLRHLAAPRGLFLSPMNGVFTTHQQVIRICHPHPPVVLVVSTIAARWICCPFWINTRCQHRIVSKDHRIFFSCQPRKIGMTLWWTYSLRTWKWHIYSWLAH